MRPFHWPFVFACAALLSALLCSQARADYTVTFSQDGSNVVATGSGTIDLTGLRFVGGVSGSSNANVYPAGGGEELGAPAAGQDVYNGFTGPTSFGSGGFAPASTSSGDAVGLELTGLATDGPTGIYLPQGYVSGASLSDTATWDNTTLAGLGLTTGTYTFSWDTVEAGVASPDVPPMTGTYTVVVSAAPTSGSSTPLPSGFALGLLGLGTLAFAVRRYKIEAC